MFILDLSPSTTVQVSLNYVVDHQTVETAKLVIKVKRQSSDDFAKIEASETTFTQVCKDLIEGWSEFKDDQGNGVDFSDDRLAKLLAVQGIPNQLYLQIRHAHLKALEKN